MSELLIFCCLYASDIILKIAKNDTSCKPTTLNFRLYCRFFGQSFHSFATFAICCERVVLVAELSVSVRLYNSVVYVVVECCFRSQTLIL